MVNNISFGLKKQLNGTNMKRQTKCTLHKTRVRPILTHGSECWTLSKEDGNMRRMFEGRGILRMIYGPINDSGI
jgi:hypothetical protein